MTDNEIIKAKEHFQYGISHDIFKEPVLSYAKTVLWAFEEINRQKAEMKSLIEKLEALGDPLQDAQYKMAEQQAEIERLKKSLDNMTDALVKTDEACRKAKAEAIKELAEQYEKIKTDRLICSFCCFKDGVDNLVKEMVGDVE